MSFPAISPDVEAHLRPFVYLECDEDLLLGDGLRGHVLHPRRGVVRGPRLAHRREHVRVGHAVRDLAVVAEVVCRVAVDVVVRCEDERSLVAVVGIDRPVVPASPVRQVVYYEIRGNARKPQNGTGETKAAD